MTYQELAQQSVLSYGDIARILGVSRQAIAQKALRDVPPNEAAIVAAELRGTVDMLNDDAPKTVKEYKSMYRPIWRDGAYVWEDIDGNVYNPPKEEGPQWFEDAVSKVAAYLKASYTQYRQIVATLPAGDQAYHEQTQYAYEVRLHADESGSIWYSCGDPQYDTILGDFCAYTTLDMTTDHDGAARGILTDLEESYFDAIYADESPTEDGFRQLLTNL